MEPPHGRGKVACTDQTIQPDGITPAQAGKSPACRVHPCTGRDHPRVGGEKMLARVHTSTSRGSPPHGREKAKPALILRVVKDHPRMGGEKISFFFTGCSPRGSPPHRRGKVKQILHAVFDVGITPAWAGKSPDCAPPWSGCRDHPRTGGERSGMKGMKSWKLGSPPHRRGKGIQADGAGAWAGITPAQAGKRSGPSCG